MRAKKKAAIGGKRKGSGRKRKNTVPVTMKLHPETLVFLDHATLYREFVPDDKDPKSYSSKGSRSQTVEAIVLRVAEKELRHAVDKLRLRDWPQEVTWGLDDFVKMAGLSIPYGLVFERRCYKDEVWGDSNSLYLKLADGHAYDPSCGSFSTARR